MSPSTRSILIYDDLRRIAVLHTKVLHMIISRNAIEKFFESEEIRGNNRSTSLTLKDVLKEAGNLGVNVNISFGPVGSGAYALGRKLLEDQAKAIDLGNSPVYELTQPLDMTEMVTRFESNEYHIICFVSDVPSDMLRLQLENPDVRLLSLDPASLNHFLGERKDVLNIAKIPADAGYRCQTEKDDDILTIGTHAVLLVTKSFDTDIAERLTQAFLDPASAARLQLTPEQMVASVAEGIALHNGAKKYYKEVGILFDPPTEFDKFVEKFDSGLLPLAHILGILAVTVGAYQGIITLRRNSTTNEIGRRVLAITIESNSVDSVRNLIQIRAEIQEHVQRRWNHLHVLLKILRALQWQILSHFSNGELSSDQHHTLLELIHESQAEHNVTS